MADHWTVYGVHAVRPREICATQYVTANLNDAETYAQDMSNDEEVLAAAVTSYAVGQLGLNKSVSLFVKGKRQQVPYISDDRRVYANGHGTASAYSCR